MNKLKLGSLLAIAVLTGFCIYGSKDSMGSQESMEPMSMSTDEVGEAPTGLIGSWYCDEMASDNETYTGFYALYINEDGTFSMYDTCGNPGIAGTLGTLGETAPEDEQGTIHISCDTEDFDPPICWNISEEADLEYEMLENDRMRLGHDDIWISFTNDHSKEIQYFDLADDVKSGYKWVSHMDGEGTVELEMTAVDDEDMGQCDMYTMLPGKTGDLTLTMSYEKEGNVKYQIVFDLSVNETGTITRHSCEGDLDQITLY